MKPEPLTADELTGLLTRLPGWGLEGAALVKSFRFETYLDGIEFVRRLAVAAEEMNHHPDLLIGWRKVTVTLTTHSAGAVTRLDEALAGRAEELARA